MNAKHVKAEMTPNIPIAIGIQRNVTSIFALNLVSKFENNQVPMDALLQTDVTHISICQTEEYVELLWKLFDLSCLNGLFLFLTEEA